MLDGLFVIMFISALFLTLYAERVNSVIFHMLALIIGMVLFVQCLYIEDVAGNIYQEPGVGAICLGFVFINIILIIMEFPEWIKQFKDRSEYR